jgi:hypothetical protein
MKNPFKPNPSPKMVQVGGFAPGIVDDFAVRKDVNTISGKIQKVPTANDDIANKAYVDSVAGAAGAPTDAKYIVQTANGVLTQEQALDILGTGLVKNTTGTGVLSIAIENTDYAAANKGVTNGDSHDHSGGDGAQINHTTLSNIGTNTHAQIDTAVTASTNHISDSSDPHGATLTQTTLDVTTLKISSVDVTSSAAELNILDGVTSTAAELNKVDGYTGSAADLNTAVAHAVDNTQAHSDYLLNSEADTGVGLTLTGDNSSADTAYVPMVLYNTDATPPAASGFPVGTIYIQYTA